MRTFINKHTHAMDKLYAQRLRQNWRNFTTSKAPPSTSSKKVEFRQFTKKFLADDEFNEYISTNETNSFKYVYLQSETFTASSLQKYDEWLETRWGGVVFQRGEVDEDNARKKRSNTQFFHSGNKTTPKQTAKHRIKNRRQKSCTRPRCFRHFRNVNG